MKWPISLTRIALNGLQNNHHFKSSIIADGMIFWMIMRYLDSVKIPLNSDRSSTVNRVALYLNFVLQSKLRWWICLCDELCPPSMQFENRLQFLNLYCACNNPDFFIVFYNILFEKSTHTHTHIQNQREEKKKQLIKRKKL